MGLDAGMEAALVLTGATESSELATSAISPAGVIYQFSDLLAGQGLG
jgi:ribonucleotide monophosphatase NagD (HAD superfamily)